MQRAIRKIYIAKRDSSLTFKGIAAAIIAISFLYLQGGQFIDVITALLAGSIGYLVVEILIADYTHNLFQNSSDP